MLLLQIEELEGELASITKEYTAASAKYKNFASTLVNHEDRSSVLEFKLQGEQSHVKSSRHNI